VYKFAASQGYRSAFVEQHLREMMINPPVSEVEEDTPVSISAGVDVDDVAENKLPCPTSMPTSVSVTASSSSPSSSSMASNGTLSPDYLSPVLTNATIPSPSPSPSPSSYDIEVPEHIVQGQLHEDGEGLQTVPPPVISVPVTGTATIKISATTTVTVNVPASSDSAEIPAPAPASGPAKTEVDGISAVTASNPAAIVATTTTTTTPTPELTTENTPSEPTEVDLSKFDDKDVPEESHKLYSKHIQIGPPVSVPSPAPAPAPVSVSVAASVAALSESDKTPQSDSGDESSSNAQLSVPSQIPDSEEVMIPLIPWVSHKSHRRELVAVDHVFYLNPSEQVWKQNI
jgi:hypothetical protein